MRGVTVDGQPVLLVNVEGMVRAFEDRCAHQAVPLSQGRFADGILTCSAHEWTFDARTGNSINPWGECIKRFPTQIRGNDIFVDVEGVVNDD